MTASNTTISSFLSVHACLKMTTYHQVATQSQFHQSAKLHYQLNETSPADLPCNVNSCVRKNNLHGQSVTGLWHRYLRRISSFQ